MRNPNTLQSKLNSKTKAIISFICGIFSGPLTIIFAVFFELLRRIYPAVPIFFINVIFLLGIPAIIGLILGILGLKSTKRNFAIAGIILCLIGLLFPLYYFLFV